jgi:hypothetical protein
MKKTMRAASLAGVCFAVLTGCGGMETEGLEAAPEELGQVEAGISFSGHTTFLPAHGGTGGIATRLSCPSGYVVSGIHGRDYDVIDQIGLRCSVLNSDGSLGGTYNTTAVGGGGGAAFVLNCPAGQVVVGFYGRSAARVDRVGLYCSTPAYSISVGAAQYSSTAVGGSGGTAFYDSTYKGYVVTGLDVRYGATVDQIRGIASHLNP